MPDQRTHKISSGDTSQSRDMYFAIYQLLSTAGEDVFRQYRSDFFDLVIIDECHRGASRDDSSWRAVLDHFAPAVHFGMTATPLREDARDTYDYFGDAVYTYSLRQAQGLGGQHARARRSVMRLLGEIEALVAEVAP